MHNRKQLFTIINEEQYHCLAKKKLHIKSETLSENVLSEKAFIDPS